MYCSNCGAKVNEDARFCINCGKRIDNNNEIRTDSYGKNKCKFLREIRKTIAQMNHVDICFPECTHTGSCRGTCPVCDREISELETALKEKVSKGEQVFLPDVTVDHQEIIPSNLRMVQAPTKERTDLMGFQRMVIEDILPADRHDENDFKLNKKNRFPWRK